MTETGARVRRAVTSRAGGVSKAPYDTFNLGDHVGDDPAAVAANRERLARDLGLAPDRLVWMEQIHSRTVAVVDGPVAEPIPATDALVTDQPDLALVVMTADCVPVLLSDDEAGVIAAVHAGRIGARIGIVPATLEKMVELGARPERIGALLGPAASGENYEVPPEMQADVEAHLPGSACKTRRAPRAWTCVLGSPASCWRPGWPPSPRIRAAPSTTRTCSVTVVRRPPAVSAR